MFVTTLPASPENQMVRGLAPVQDPIVTVLKGVGETLAFDEAVGACGDAVGAAVVVDVDWTRGWVAVHAASRRPTPAIANCFILRIYDR